MNSPSYYTSATITLALTLDTAVMDVSIDCRYNFYPDSQIDEYSPVESAHVELQEAFIADKYSKFNMINVLNQDDSMIAMIESTLLEIELNNQE